MPRQYLQVDHGAIRYGRHGAQSSSWRQVLDRLRGDELPHPGTLKKLREQGISTHAHHARQVRATEYGEWDLFVYMDRENLHGLESIFGGDPQKKFVRLLDFLPDDDPRHGKDVADPWYTGNFDATYRDVVAGCRGLLSKLEGER